MRIHFNCFMFWLCCVASIQWSSARAQAQIQTAKEEVRNSSTDSLGNIPNICDHHVHLLSPQLVKHWKSLGVPFSHEDDYYSDADRFLKDEALNSGLVLSMAYLYASHFFEELKGVEENGAAWLKAENDFIAKLVAKHPNKLIGFGSANPTTPEGLSEYERCFEELKLPGFKIHVQASGIDWLNEKHVASIKQLFQFAEANEVFVLLHFSMFDEDAAKEKAEVFVREVLIPYPKQKLILAHMAGAGAYRQQNRDAINVFLSHLKTDKRLKETQIYFELSAALLPRASQGVEPPGEEMVNALAKDIKTIGIDRVVFGSDYPVFGAKEYFQHLLKTLPLDKSEIEQILNNRIEGLTDLQKD